MDLPHEGYFYALATVGITFAGFATILMALREGRGSDPRERAERSSGSFGGTSAASTRERPERRHGMSRFHLWVAKSYIQSGLVTAMCAMLPPLLFAFGMKEDLTWRASSLLIGVPALIMLATAPREWRKVTDMPIRPRLWVQVALGALINGFLLLNALGWPLPPAAGPVMLAVSWNLFSFFAQFAESVSFFFEDKEDGLL